VAYFNTYPMKSSTILRVNSERDRIDISPEYQRHGDIWTLEKRQLLIDSILNDYDIPKLYFYVLPMEEKAEYDYAIIDGRQRLEAIWSFIEGRFSLADDFVFLKDNQVKASGYTYNDLAKECPKVRILFDSFILPVVCVETDDMDLIEDMFCRLNEAVPLNAAEKRNAFGGPMARLVRKIPESDFFKRNARFTNSRYQHMEVAVKLLYIEEMLSVGKIIPDTIKQHLDDYVRKYKVENLKTNKVGTAVREVLDKMHAVFTERDNLLSAQSAVPIYFLLFREAMKNDKIELIKRNKFSKFVQAIANNRLIAEEDISRANWDLLEYDRMSQQGANYAPSIKERFRIIREFFNI